MKKERLQMLSDGVIVIIMTIMVFEIKIPDMATIGSLGDFLPFLQHVGVYAMSFLVLAVMWLNHHHIFADIEMVNAKVVWINFLLLFFMSLIPLPTKGLGENIFFVSSNIFYGVVLSCNSIVYTLLQYQVNKGDDRLPTRVKKTINRKNCFATTLYFLSIPLSVLSIYLSLAIFLAIPAMYFLPSSKITDN